MDYDYGNQDFWGEALKNTWDIIWPADGITGSWIWEWQDQGMQDKFSDRRGVDPVTGMREENNKGVVTSDRKLKPPYWNVKMVYSPVMPSPRRDTSLRGQWPIASSRIQNRYSFTDLSELTCRWQSLPPGARNCRTVNDVSPANPVLHRRGFEAVPPPRTGPYGRATA